MKYRGRKALFVAVGIYLLGVVIVTGCWLTFLKHENLSTFDKRLLDAAKALPGLLPMDFHDRALNKNSIGPKEDQRNLDNLSTHAHIGGFAYLYTYVIDKGQIYFTASNNNDDDVAHGNVSSYWTTYTEGDRAYFDAIHSTDPVFVTASDRWGSFRTVLIPRQSPAGNPYVIGVDIDVSEIDKTIWKQVPRVVGAAFLLLLFAVPIGITMRHTLVANNRDMRVQLDKNKKVAKKLLKAMKKANIANQSKGRFLANISHELRTPLNGVTGMIDFLLDTQLDSTQLEYAQGIKQCSQTLLETIYHVLDIASIESGTIYFKHRAVELRDWLDQHMAIFSMPLTRKNIDLSIIVTPDLPQYIKTDPDQLWKIIGNLIGNAIKYTQHGGVKVSINWQDGNLFTQVEDTGIGIPSEKQKMVFDAFFQVDDSHTRRNEGTGLGLTLARDLCALMGGRLWLERSNTHGSLFCFCIPAEIDETQAESCDLLQNKTEEDDSEGLPMPKIAVLTNFVAITQQIQSVLQQDGYVVEEYGSLDKLSEQLLQQYHAIIVDSNLGIDALRLFHSDQSGKKLPEHTLLILLHWLGEKVPGTIRPGMHRLIKPLTTRALKQVLALSSETSLTGQDIKVSQTLENLPSSALILIVEDNAVNRMIVQRMLAKVGVITDTANNGLEAVLAVQQKRYDLVLMDVQMPEMDGLQATRIIITEQGKNAPVIIGLSAHATLDQIEEGKSAGMQGYLTKPIQWDLLYTTLQRFLAKVD